MRSRIVLSDGSHLKRHAKWPRNIPILADRPISLECAQESDVLRNVLLEVVNRLLVGMADGEREILFLAAFSAQRITVRLLV